MEGSQDFWVGFTALDWVIIITILLSMVMSLVRGFAREVISLLTWGVLFGYRFITQTSSHLPYLI